jgi:hypothetical protein
LTIKFSQDKKAAISIVKERDDLFQPQTGGEFPILLFWPLRKDSGADRDRTGDLRRAKPALSQLSYSPKNFSAEKFLSMPLSQNPDHRKSWWA